MLYPPKTGKEPLLSWQVVFLLKRIKRNKIVNPPIVALLANVLRYESEKMRQGVR